MASIRSKNTKCELELRAALRNIGIRGYRVNYGRLSGTPDIVFIRKKIAVFCDSEFWHGAKGIPSTNQEYWRKKLQKNVARDAAVNRALIDAGWKILRFRESEILRDPTESARKIRDALSIIR